METFITTCGIVLPTFFMIALGYLLRLLHVVSKAGGAGMNVLAFKVLIPAMVFYNIYRSPLDSVANWRLMGFAAGSVTVLFLLLMLVMPLIEKDNARRGVMVQGIFRSSFVVLGLGLVSSMYPDASTGVTAMLSAVIAPLFNGYAVIALETYGREKIDIKRIALGIITNPLIIGSVLGIAALLLRLRLPPTLDKTVSSLSSMATPLALLVLGSSFRVSSVGGHARQLAIACVGRLVLVPLVLLPVSVMMGFRGVELLSLLVLFGSPNAVSSHIMAYNSGADDQLAGQIVVFSTCLSVFTLFVFIYVLLSMGFL